jgi:hypothetical protein
MWASRSTKREDCCISTSSKKPKRHAGDHARPVETCHASHKDALSTPEVLRDLAGYSQNTGVLGRIHICVHVIERDSNHLDVSKCWLMPGRRKHNHIGEVLHVVSVCWSSSYVELTSHSNRHVDFAERHESIVARAGKVRHGHRQDCTRHRFHNIGTRMSCHIHPTVRSRQSRHRPLALGRTSRYTACPCRRRQCTRRWHRKHASPNEEGCRDDQELLGNV